MATYIHGIAASENIDSSGEIISIAGLDISSLDKDGVFNFEHESKQPSQIVGKILKSKKIFSEQDCEDEHQLYFWQKVQVPFVYVMGELMDDYKESAKDVAGMFRYDADRKGKQERNVMNFSIEGSKIEKQGNVVTRSIGRKVTLTPLPCNKAAVAEIVPADIKSKKDDIDSLFKTENHVEIELFKIESKEALTSMAMAEHPTKHASVLGIEPFKKELPMNKPPIRSGISPKTLSGMAKPTPKAAPGDASLPKTTTGKKLGSTKSGKEIFTHAKIHDYRGFSSQDHQEAANMHYNAAKAAKDRIDGKNHMDKMNLHLQAAKSAERKESRFAVGREQARQKALAFGKSLDAGAGNVAPSQLTGGAALAKESLEGKKGKKDKKYWLKRAEEEYNHWEKKEAFRSFMQKKMPHLALGEIDAIGKTLALKKSLDAENTLVNMVKVEELKKDENKE